MTGRRKIEAALSPNGCEQTPVVICYEGIFIRDHWDQITASPWWYAQSPDIEHQLAWRRAAIERIGQDWFVLPTCLPRRRRDRLRIEERPDGVFRVDAVTGHAEPLERPQVGGWTRGGVQSVHPADPPMTVEQIDARIPLPDPADLRNLRDDGRADLADRLLEKFGRERFPFCHVLSPLWCCYPLWGFEGMMTMIADRPDLVAHACRRYLAVGQHRVREAALLGAAGIWIEDCFSDLISPQAFEALHLRALVPLIDEIRAAGMRSIYYFCGNPHGKWDLIASSGADALSFEETKKNFAIDIEDVVARAPDRRAVLGNLDAVGVLQDGTDDDLRREIERQVAAGRANGGRFILSLGSPVTPDTPLSRVQRYCELGRPAGGRS